MTTASMYSKIQLLPDEVKQEVSDFIDFLVERKGIKKEKAIPQFGSLKGKIHMADDFDAPLDEFKEYM